MFVESLANPGGVVADLAALADVAHLASIPLIVDNTLATPYLCRPFEWGADLVVHSLTKFLSGHGTSMGGMLVESGQFDWKRSGKFPFVAGPDEAYHGLDFFETFGDFGFSMKARAVALRDLGPALSPTNAFHILTGIETLPLRMERHVANARAVAEHLVGHPAVAWVSYAGLPSSPSYELAHRYLPRGAGSVFTFGVRGGYDAGIRVVESVDLWSHLANVGDTRSLILHPASTTHRQLSDEERLAAGAGPDVIRLSVGIEDVARPDRRPGSRPDMTKPARLPAGLVVTRSGRLSARQALVEQDLHELVVLRGVDHPQHRARCADCSRCSTRTDRARCWERHPDRRPPSRSCCRRRPRRPSARRP